MRTDDKRFRICSGLQNCCATDSGCAVVVVEPVAVCECFDVPPLALRVERRAFFFAFNVSIG